MASKSKSQSTLITAPSYVLDDEHGKEFGRAIAEAAATAVEMVNTARGTLKERVLALEGKPSEIFAEVRKGISEYFAEMKKANKAKANFATRMKSEILKVIDAIQFYPEKINQLPENPRLGNWHDLVKAARTVTPKTNKHKTVKAVKAKAFESLITKLQGRLTWQQALQLVHFGLSELRSRTDDESLLFYIGKAEEALGDLSVAKSEAQEVQTRSEPLAVPAV